MSFLQPKVSTSPPPAPPTIDDTAGTQQDYSDMLLRRQGRASAILTPASGPGTPLTASKTLLGS